MSDTFEGSGAPPAPDPESAQPQPAQNQQQAAAPQPAQPQPQPAQDPQQTVAPQPAQAQPQPQAPEEQLAEAAGIDPAAPREVNTQNAQHDGVNRCPRCGSTEIQFRQSTGMLICLFCRYEWTEQRVEDGILDQTPIENLRGVTVGSGAGDIDDGAAELMTIKCQGCGAEVVINIAYAMSARCHWCRHVLTVNQQVPNGAVPDAILPFSVTHEQAVANIGEFAGKRRLFAHSRFKKEFTPENVVGVYLPYMVVDGNASADAWGYGEVLTRQYTRGSGDDRKTYYDADVYQVQRHVDFTVDDLTIESSAERADMNTFVNTNNIINTILPFDTENAVRWNANYLSGFSSEKRTQDVSQVEPVFESQLLSIARSEMSPTISTYNRGVRWEHERLQVHGSRWVAMYLPVWLYSYYHESGGNGMVHYIAVNGRTGETMGSIPVSQWRLLAAALSVGTVLEGAVIAFLWATL